MDTAEVSEVFATVQGEGPHVGMPSVFVRFRRCNLACVWCDTKYTWDKNHPDYETYDTYTPEQLAHHVEELRRMGVPRYRQEQMDEVFSGTNGVLTIMARMEIENLVLTGGEPMIWKPFIQRFLNALSEPFGNVEIETNGLVPPFDDDVHSEHRVWYNVSPKLAHSGNEGRKRYNPWAIATLARTGRARWKIVTTSEDAGDSDSELGTLVVALARQGVDINEDLYLMPLGATRAELKQNSEKVRALAQNLGIKFSPRIHIEVWNDERGV